MTRWFDRSSPDSSAQRVHARESIGKTLVNIYFKMISERMHASSSWIESNNCVTSADQPIALSPRTHVEVDATNEPCFASAQSQKRRGELVRQKRNRCIPGDMPVTQQASIVGIACGQSVKWAATAQPATHLCKSRACNLQTTRRDRHTFRQRPRGWKENRARL